MQKSDLALKEKHVSFKYSFLRNLLYCLLGCSADIFINFQNLIAQFIALFFMYLVNLRDLTYFTKRIALAKD